jgi:molecular chaperone GrpE (heat shock protein)
MSEQKPVLKEEDAIRIHQELVARNKVINERLIRLEEELKSYQREYEKECQKAVELIGTSDIDECRNIYVEKRKANSDSLYEIMNAYDDIEAVLANIEDARGNMEE